MEDLPAELTIDILSRLPVKTIIHCKFVCKKWRSFVSDSSFVDLHLSRSPTGLVIHNKPDRSKHESIDPGILKWVEIEDNVDHHHLNHDPLMSLDLNRAPILQNSRISQMGSVNGLICLWQCNYPELDNIYICNPITGEYMILPGQGYQWIHGIAIPIHAPHSRSITYGFGVGSLTREYKVVRTIQGRQPNGELSVVEAEIYTLGTGQWRSLGHVPYGLAGMYKSYGPFLNGHCHWIVDDDEDTPERLCTFDLDKETFQLFPPPPAEAINEFHDQSVALLNQSLAVLKGCLCQLDNTYMFHFTIWVMKEYGIKKSWHKEVVINHRYIDPEWPLEPFSLIEGLKDGSILAISEERLWVFYPRSETIEDKVMFDRTMSGVVYRPSFLKLENFESERVQMF